MVKGLREGVPQSVVFLGGSVTFGRGATFWGSGKLGADSMASPAAAGAGMLARSTVNRIQAGMLGWRPRHLSRHSLATARPCPPAAYPVLFMDWLQRSFPEAPHFYKNAAIPASTSAIAAACTETLVPAVRPPSP